MTEKLPSIDEWIEEQDFETTAEIKVPEKLIDQVIGQDKAVEIIKKAAQQKRHVMLIGDPGTGKSMMARAMTEFLPKEELEDILVYPNPEDPNTPLIRVVPAGKGKEIVRQKKLEARKKSEQQSSFILSLSFLIIITSIFYAVVSKHLEYALFGLFAGILIYAFLARGAMSPNRIELQNTPKLLVGHEKDDKPPFVDATAAHSGALLGDVRHDPFQSAGLETPPHQLVEAGAIHRAHKGVLYIDEINTLSLQSQQHLLTAIQ
ncbi:MAG TPA: ATP-dependent protease LonB, partial [Thermoplasmatales archaeon]|nr:ATP-dependent protease LonB [Thermoplasmatales archaeon]